MAKESAKSPNDAELDRDSSRREWRLSRASVAVAGQCARRPILCLALAAFATLVALFFAFCYLETTASDSRTFAPKSRGARLERDYLEELANPVEACLIVEQRNSATTEEEVRRALAAARDELAARPEFFKVISGGLDGESFKSNRLYFFSPEEYRQAEELADVATELGRGDWSRFAADAYARAITRLVEDELVNDVANPRSPETALAFARSLVETTTANRIAPETTPSPVAPGVEAAVPEKLVDDPFHFFKSNATLVGYLRYAFVDGLTHEDQRRAIQAIDHLVENVQAAWPHVIVEATGEPLLERQEFNSFKRATWKQLLFLVASVLVFSWGFYGGAISPFVALATLLAGLAWTLGVQTLLLRTTSVDNVHAWLVVVALAINSVAVYLAKYASLRRTERSASEAIMTTAASTGASLATYAALVLLVMLAFGLAKPEGRAFCVITGVGVALCSLATLVVTPSLLRLLDSGRPFRSHETLAPLGFEQGRTNPYLGAIAVVGMVVAAIVSLGVAKLTIDPTRTSFYRDRFADFNASASASQYLESHALYGVIFADTEEEAESVAARIAELDAGAGKRFFVDNVTERLPRVDPDAYVRVEKIHDALASLEPEIGAIPVASRESLVAALEELRRASGAFPSRNDNIALAEYLDRALEQLGTLSEREYEKRLDVFSRLLAHETLRRLYTLQEASDPRKPCLDDLSDALKTRYVGQRTGRVVLRVYSPRSLADSKSLSTFVTTLREIDPDATGPAVLTLEESLQTRRWLGGCLATLVLLFTVVASIRFHSVRGSFAVVLTPCAALLELAGLAGLRDLPLDPVNWLAIPSVVFLTLYGALRFAEDYEESPERIFSRENALSTCATAATLVGFYVFGLVCPELGWQNLGRLGVMHAAIYAGATLLLVPALLNWRAARSPESDSCAQERDETNQADAVERATDVDGQP